jgi:hypothetical protein
LPCISCEWAPIPAFLYTGFFFFLSFSTFWKEMLVWGYHCGAALKYEGYFFFLNQKHWLTPVDKFSIALRLHTNIFFYHQMAILAKMQGPDNVILTTLKKKKNKWIWAIFRCQRWIYFSVGWLPSLSS